MKEYERLVSEENNASLVNEKILQSQYGFREQRQIYTEEFLKQSHDIKLALSLKHSLSLVLDCLLY